MRLGETLRELREKKGLLLRQVAAELEVDTALVSKMERGEKPVKREHLTRLANIYGIQEEQLVTQWLSDKVFDIVKEEETGQRALKMTLKKLQGND